MLMTFDDHLSEPSRPGRTEQDLAFARCPGDHRPGSQGERCCWEALQAQ